MDRDRAAQIAIERLAESVAAIEAVTSVTSVTKVAATEAREAAAQRRAVVKKPKVRPRTASHEVADEEEGGNEEGVELKPSHYL